MDMQDMMFGAIGLLAIGCLVGYYFLSRALAQTDQVLVVWEKVAETPILGNYVGSIFTMLMKIRNPYSRSIRTHPSPLFPGGGRLVVDSRFPDYVAGSGTMSRNLEEEMEFRWTVSVYSWRCPHIVCRDISWSCRLLPLKSKRKGNSPQN
jgi:hypothetical protein